MDLNVVLPFLSSLLSFVFAALVGDQWLRRRQPYQLVWTVGLILFGLGAAIEVLGGALGWSEPLYRGWYLFGAFGVAASLGLGTIYLLNRTRFGYFVAFSFLAAALFSYLTAVRYEREGATPADSVIIGVVVVCVLSAVGVAITTMFRRDWIGHVVAAILSVGWSVAFVATLVVPIPQPGYAIADNGVPIGAAMLPDLRILTPPFNIVGAFALIGGAVFSAYIFMPKVRVLRVTTTIPVIGAIGRGVAVAVNFVASLPSALGALHAGTLHSRVLATILIAIGGLVLGSSDGLSRFGITAGFFIGQLIGLILIFLGFLVSIEVFSDVRLPFTRIVLRRRDREPAG